MNLSNKIIPLQVHWSVALSKHVKLNILFFQRACELNHSSCAIEWFKDNPRSSPNIHTFGVCHRNHHSSILLATHNTFLLSFRNTKPERTKKSPFAKFTIYGQRTNDRSTTWFLL